MTSPVRFGILGCAAIARRRVLPAMAADPGIEIAAIASRSPATAADTAARFGGRPVTGYEAVLDDPAVEAVYVPLPLALHAAWVEAALLTGRHVLAEKPLTRDPERTRALLALAERRAVVLRENVMFVHHPQHARVRRLVEEGAVGRLRAFHASFTIPAPAPGDIRYDAALGGGSLWDVGLYPVRAAVHLLGDDLRLVGAHLSTPAGGGVDIGGAALLRRGDGVSAQLTFGMDHAYRGAYELWGSEGRITVDRAFTPPADHSPRIVLDDASGTREIRLPAHDQVAATLADFCASVRRRRAGLPDDADHRELLAQARLLAAVHRAGQAGGDLTRPRRNAP
ncbi:Gfo/Idh/MocA family protein [Streptomyces sp. NRRL F-5727]|uniref:Gfo/Idh/MocA family protein n=1 Tax=Streptomyces sp. NRRL F-5727 TaxID=1463871 RepID=UPI00068B178E|nr:Gfo/Idh/MocA family oxidoreductase [Streptomyces sp. NRRL F-5727]